MGLIKAVIYLTISIILGVLLTQNDYKILKQIPGVGIILSKMKNIEFIIIITTFFLLTMSF